MESPKHALFRHFAKLGGALAHSGRLELLDLLAQGEKTVETLAGQSGISVKSTSAHLRTLREAAMVATRREGTWVFYRLADPSVHDLLTILQVVGERQLATVREIVRDYFTAPEGFDPVDLETLAGRLEDGTVTVLDVRPRDEYDQGHIPGALSVPLAHLADHLATMPRDADIVAYCRGPYCLLAVEAATLLRHHGFRASRLADGLPAWARRGFPVAVGNSTKGDS